MSVPAIADPRADALAYLEEHKLIRLFHLLGSKLAYMKPDDPNTFLASELNKISAMSSRGQAVSIFSEQDLEMMFTVYDITSRGYLTQVQYTTAVAAVGVDNPTLPRPPGEMIDKKTFVTFL